MHIYILDLFVTNKRRPKLLRQYASCEQQMKAIHRAKFGGFFLR
jgi:hypothetical protein